MCHSVHEDWVQCSALSKLHRMTRPVFGKRWQDNQKFKARREFEVSLGYMKSYLEDEKKNYLLRN